MNHQGDEKGKGMRGGGWDEARGIPGPSIRPWYFLVARCTAPIFSQGSHKGGQEHSDNECHEPDDQGNEQGFDPPDFVHILQHQ